MKRSNEEGRLEDKKEAEEKMRMEEEGKRGGQGGAEACQDSGLWPLSSLQHSRRQDQSLSLEPFLALALATPMSAHPEL